MKYPRTPYFDFSDSVDREDVRESGYFNIENFLGKELVATIKMDGSNCLWTHDHIAARNGTHATGSSFDYAKQLHAAVKDRIPPNIYIYGEWLYAKHSILYDNLDGYFQVFGVYNTTANVWGSWQDVQSYARLVGAINVPGVRIIEPTENKKTLIELITYIAQTVIAQGHEGIVVRNIDSFNSKEFNKNIAKFVRENHVQTDRHWSKQKVVINKVVNQKL
jgi:hypothetical protein